MFLDNFIVWVIVIKANSVANREQYNNYSKCLEEIDSKDNKEPKEKDSKGSKGCREKDSSKGRDCSVKGS